jgi:hypothetical protein
MVVLAAAAWFVTRGRAEDQHVRAEKHRIAAARVALMTPRMVSATPSATLITSRTQSSGQAQRAQEISGLSVYHGP